MSEQTTLPETVQTEVRDLASGYGGSDGLEREITRLVLAAYTAGAAQERERCIAAIQANLRREVRREAYRIVNQVRAQDGLPPLDMDDAPPTPEPLCRCPSNECLLHPSLKTCGMRERTPPIPEGPGQ